MRVNSLKNNISFGKALNSKQMEEYGHVLRSAENILGKDGKNILIVHDASLPQTINTGMGNLGDKKAVEFIELMQKYVGINTVEVLPQTQYQPYDNSYIPYKGSSLSLSPHLISPELLANDEYGNLIDISDVNLLDYTNSNENKYTKVAYENLLGKNNTYDTLLSDAHKKFKKLDANKPIKVEFKEFKKENSKMLEYKTIFQKLAFENGFEWEKWSDVDKNLYNSNSPEMAKRLGELKGKYRDDIDFFAFKQFLANKHLKESKLDLNAKGIELFGDCLMGFSHDEIWANQSAFHPTRTMGDPQWDIRSIDFDKIHNADGTLGDGGKLLQEKFSSFFKKYDGVRFDVGWAYIRPEPSKYMDDEVLKLIEKTAKEIKGENFDLTKLLYETEADPKDFLAFNYYENGKSNVIKPLKNRTQIYTTVRKNNNWGSVEAYKVARQMSDDEFVIGVGNHDSVSLRALANGATAIDNGNTVELRNAQYEQLANYLKLDGDEIKNPIQFVKAKFAEIFCAKNKMFFFNDILGSEEIFDDHIAENNPKNYRIKIPENFEETYHKAIQEGWGLNPMDAIKKAFVAQGKDKEYPKLFVKIEEFANILDEAGVTTQKNADELLAEAMNPIKKSFKILPIVTSILGAALGIFIMKRISVKKQAENDVGKKTRA